MKRFVLTVAAALVALFGGAVAIIDWAMHEPPVAEVDAPTPGGLAPMNAAAASTPWSEPIPSSPARVPSPADRPEREDVAATVDAHASDARQRDAERILAELEQTLVGSQAAQRCVAEGQEAAVEIRLTIDPSGVTYRLGPSVDSAVGYCLTMQALPDILSTVSPPSGVGRATREVRVPAG